MNIFIAKIEGLKASLEEEESWHCCKVLRKKAGDAVGVIDGKGLYAVGHLDLVSEKKCVVNLSKEPQLQLKRNYHLHLAIAPTKQLDRIEWMIEKAVEIGIDELSFLQCKNSERVNLKIERIHKITESAAKQSIQAYLPTVNQLGSFNDFMLNHQAELKLIAHCNEGKKMPLLKLDVKNKNLLILIGPEGDFTEEEVKVAKSHHFLEVSLGTNRLRTETAGLYACQAVSILSQL